MRRPLDDPFTRAAKVVASIGVPVGPWDALLLSGEALSYDSYPLIVQDPRPGRELAEKAAGDLVREVRQVALRPDATPGFFISRIRTYARQHQADLYGSSPVNSVELTVTQVRVLRQAIRAAWAAGDAQAAGLLQAIGDCYAKHGQASEDDLVAEGITEGLLESEVAAYFMQWRVGTPWARRLLPDTLRVMDAVTSSEEIASERVAAMLSAATAAGDDLVVAVLAAFHHSLLGEHQHLTYDEIAARAEITPGLLVAVLDDAPRWFSADGRWTRRLDW